MAKRPLPSPEVLRQLLSYDPETGKLFWKRRDERWFVGTSKSPKVLAKWWNGRFAEKEAFTPVNSAGYHTGTVLLKMLQAHRIAWAIYHGDWPKGFLDHINGVRTDNRIANLREVTPLQNAMNQSPIPRGSSGIRGVRFDSRFERWQARINVSKRQKHLGYFDTAQEAQRAYAIAVEKYHGEFSRT